MTFSAATLSGVVEPRAFRPQENFLANCQQRRLRKIDDVIDDPDRSSDENVYQFARSIADREGCALVVDLCAGSGRQFERFFASRSWETLQVDWIDRRQVSDTDESRPFLKVNLEIYDDLENLEAVLDSSRPTLFILSDVVGRLQDLRPLFRTLRRLLKRHPSNRLVATTPDRDQFDESEPGRLPENPGYVRLWTLNEFGLAVRSAGLNVQRIGWLTQDENDHRQGIVCCELSCTPEFYEDWLRNHNLPQMASDHLMLTTEHGDAERSGGIGAYVKSCDALDKSAQIVYVGFLGLPRDAWRSYCREKGWLHVFDLALVGEHSVDGIDPQDANISMYAILQVVFLCDQIRLIEYQDYEGIGYRVAQAKRAGLLPRSINVMAVAHGNHFYLDYASDSIDTRRRLTIDATERLSVELADVVVFPTQYIRRLYRDCAGYRVRSDRHLPLPATISLDGISNLERRQIETLVFFGKKTRQKGYDDFVDAVVALMTDSSSQAAKNVNRIVLLGVSEPDRRLLELPVQVEFSQRSHAEAKAMLSDFAADSLVVLPYRGDNHPLSFFEAVEADCQVLAYYAGGLPELVPTEVSEYALCNPDPNSLATGIEKALSLTHAERCEVIQLTRNRVREAYVEHTENFRRAVVELKGGSEGVCEPVPSRAVTVIVPNLNGETRLIEDVAIGLINSFHRPEKVIVVDDCSDEAGREALDRALPSFGDLSLDLIRNRVNLGLSGSRNVGLRSTQTPYICAHDNDNIILNKFLEVACRVLDENPEVSAVTSFTRMFEDGDPWQAETWREGYRPIGADFGISLRMNFLGDALAVYRVDDLMDVGGWNETSRAKWEDWELFLRLIAHGKDIWVIPEEHILYRVRPTSMLQTYSDFRGWLRLSEAFVGLPKAHAVSALRAIWVPSQPEKENLRPVLPIVDHLIANNAQLHGEVRNIERQLSSARKRLSELQSSTTWRVTSRFRNVLFRSPTLRKWLKRVWRLIQDVRRRLTGGS